MTPSPVITIEMYEVLARRQSPCFESVRDDLVNKLAEPAWYPTNSIRQEIGVVHQLWVCQELRLGEFVPTVTEWEWREVVEPPVFDEPSDIDKLAACLDDIGIKYRRNATSMESWIRITNAQDGSYLDITFRPKGNLKRY